MTPKKLAEVGCESLGREAPFKTNHGGGAVQSNHSEPLGRTRTGTSLRVQGYFVEARIKLSSPTLSRCH